MDLSFFYEPELPKGTEPFPLREETARHLVTVLRKRKGDLLWMTDGRGRKCLVEISETGKKSTLVRKVNGGGPESMLLQDAQDSGNPRESADGKSPQESPNGLASLKSPEGNPSAETAPPARPPLTLAVSLLKNPTRFEWLLEKVTEIGVGRIVPLICARTEKTSFRQDRLQNILISAMLQSQQLWLPEMKEPLAFRDFVQEQFAGNSFIAHCLPGEKKPLRASPPEKSVRILIGPEGDFTPDEISLALSKGFQPVSLGHTRLRTETAGMMAAALVHSGLRIADSVFRITDKYK